MKQYISLFLSLLLVFAMTGCQSQRADVPSTQQPDVQEPAQTETVEPTQPDTQDPTQPEEPETAEPDVQPDSLQTEDQQGAEVPEEPVVDENTSAVTEAAKDEDQAALIGHLDEIRDNVRVGTAGSSLTAAQQAANLLDWGMETVLSKEEIQTIVQDWYASIDPAGQEETQMQFSGVAGAVEQVTGEDGADLLDSAGCTASNYPWNDTAKAAAQTVLSAMQETES